MLDKLRKINIVAKVMIFIVSILVFGGVGYIVYVNSAEPKDLVTKNKNSVQEVSMDLTYDGYSPSTINIKKSVPVRWKINAKQISGCTREIMIESLGIKKELQMGENIIEFTAPDNVGELEFSCGMKMVWGKFVISEDGASSNQPEPVKTLASARPDSSCNGSCGSPSCGASKGGGCGCGRH
ncbi:MAG: cupredoxin domain-containing protein [Patescibacteria group bacterium]